MLNICQNADIQHKSYRRSVMAPHALSLLTRPYQFSTLVISADISRQRPTVDMKKILILLLLL